MMMMMMSTRATLPIPNMSTGSAEGLAPTWSCGGSGSRLGATEAPPTASFLPAPPVPFFFSRDSFNHFHETHPKTLRSTPQKAMPCLLLLA